MKKFAAMIATIALLATAATALASPRNHTCRVDVGHVTASGNTSCAFANNIANEWVGGDCQHARVCAGWAYSPITGRRYRVTCYRAGSVACYTSGHNSWIKFTWNGA